MSLFKIQNREVLFYPLFCRFSEYHSVTTRPSDSLSLDAIRTLQNSPNNLPLHSIRSRSQSRSYGKSKDIDAISSARLAAASVHLSYSPFKPPFIASPAFRSWSSSGFPLRQHPFAKPRGAAVSSPSSSIFSGGGEPEAPAARVVVDFVIDGGLGTETIARLSSWGFENLYADNREWCHLKGMDCRGYEVYNDTVKEWGAASSLQKTEELPEG